MIIVQRTKAAATLPTGAYVDLDLNGNGTLRIVDDMERSGNLLDLYNTHNTTTSWVKQLDDMSGNGRDFVQGTDAEQFEFLPNLINGLPGMRGDGTRDGVGNGTALDWRFLHDGSDFTVWVVAKPGNVADPDALYGMVGSFQVASSQTGYVLCWEDRTVVPANNAARALIGKGSSPFILDHITSDDFASANAWHSLLHKMDFGATGNDSEIRNQAASTDTDEPSGTPDTGDASFGLHFGSAARSVALVGDVTRLVIWPHVLSAEEVTQLYNYSNQEYGL